MPEETSAHASEGAAWPAEKPERAIQLVPFALLVPALVVWAIIVFSHAQPAAWRPGIVDPASGNLIAFWLQRSGGEVPVCVSHPFGVVVVWQEEPCFRFFRRVNRRFFLLNNASKSYFGTGDFNAFFCELQALPEDAVVGDIRTCNAGLKMAMPDKERQMLSDMLLRHHEPEPNGRGTWESPVCACGSDCIRFLETGPGPAQVAP